MSAQKEPRHAFIVTGSRLAAILVGITLVVQLTPAVPIRPSREEPATTQVVVRVPDNVESFRNHHLEVALYEYDPGVKGVENLVDKHFDKKFNHNRGAQTTIVLTLGANARLKAGMHYHVTVAAFDPAGKRTHLGEKDSKRGTVHVLSDGKPNQVTMIVRPARVQDIVMDIADEIKKGNDAKAAKMAQARAKDFAELIDLEDLYRRRNTHGLGWGSTPGNIAAQDGLEMKLRNLARVVPANFIQDAKNNEEAAYWIAAMAELTIARDSEFKPMGIKTKADWHKKAAAVRAEADVFAKAIAVNNVAAIQKSAAAINNACIQCHDVYRD